MCRGVSRERWLKTLKLTVAARLTLKSVDGVIKGEGKDCGRMFARMNPIMFP